MRRLLPREKALERLNEGRFDLLVIGGGITGAGVALDGASRGLRVALVERGDYSSGTSSRSSKMIHGGLRYLEHLEVGLVREAVRERDLLRRLAPHLVRPLPFVAPVVRGRVEAAALSAGLWAYDLLSLFRSVSAHRTVEASWVEARAPGLAGRVPKEALVWWDCVTDDSRLVLEVLKTATALGAVTLNHAEVVEFLTRAGRVVGAVVKERLGGESVRVWARRVVNATGVWADRLRAMEDPGGPPLLVPARGAHLVFRRQDLDVRVGVVFPSAAGDGRRLFALPWGPVVLVGTTDEREEGGLDRVAPTPGDVRYILHALCSYFDLDLGAGDAVASFAGLRPLLAGEKERTADLSRRHTVLLGPLGMVTITGGKLTTFRRMARDAVEAAFHDEALPPSRTASIALAGSRVPPEQLEAEGASLASRLGLAPELGRELAARRGEEGLEILVWSAERGLAAWVEPGLPWVVGELGWGLLHEQAAGLGDALARRTRLSLQSRDGGLSGTLPFLPHLAELTGRASPSLEAELREYAAKLKRERGLTLNPNAEEPVRA